MIDIREVYLEVYCQIVEKILSAEGMLQYSVYFSVYHNFGSEMELYGPLLHYNFTLYLRLCWEPSFAWGFLNKIQPTRL